MADETLFMLSEDLRKLAEKREKSWQLGVDKYSYDTWICFANYVISGSATYSDILIKLALKGYIPALFRLGECYESGDYGVLPNKLRATQCYRKAAEQGYLPAQSVMNPFSQGASLHSPRF